MLYIGINILVVNKWVYFVYSNTKSVLFKPIFAFKGMHMDRYYKFYERQVAMGMVITIISFVVFLVLELFK